MVLFNKTGREGLDFLLDTCADIRAAKLLSLLEAPCDLALGLCGVVCNLAALAVNCCSLRGDPFKYIVFLSNCGVAAFALPF